MSEHELEIIAFENARNTAMDQFFDARPHLKRNRESEFLFAGGFRMAWNAKNIEIGMDMGKGKDQSVTLIVPGKDHD